ncbi:hypothetical protein ON010_g14346 [Phytophthora cinnamomi]|nr:hypothetical protein ON010_g14346 [Phytophthora cinnamomi]
MGRGSGARRFMRSSTSSFENPGLKVSTAVGVEVGFRGVKSSMMWFLLSTSIGKEVSLSSAAIKLRSSGSIGSRSSVTRAANTGSSDMVVACGEVARKSNITSIDPTSLQDSVGIRARAEWIFLPGIETVPKATPEDAKHIASETFFNLVGGAPVRHAVWPAPTPKTAALATHLCWRPHAHSMKKVAPYLGSSTPAPAKHAMPMRLRGTITTILCLKAPHSDAGELYNYATESDLDAENKMRPPLGLRHRTLSGAWRTVMSTGHVSAEERLHEWKVFRARQFAHDTPQPRTIERAVSQTLGDPENYGPKCVSHSVRSPGDQRAAKQDPRCTAVDTVAVAASPRFQPTIGSPQQPPHLLRRSEPIPQVQPSPPPVTLK